jgi:CRISPR/Cas system CSM-associated protein Csm2 small subunit
MSESTGQFWVDGKDLEETIETIQRWAKHTFPEQTPERVMKHLYDEEHAELQEEFKWWKEILCSAPDLTGFVADEIADQIMLLVVLADLLKLDVKKILKDKHKKNLHAKAEYRPELGYDKMVRP